MKTYQIVERKIRCRKCGDVFIFRTNSHHDRLTEEMRNWKLQDVYPHPNQCERETRMVSR